MFFLGRPPPAVWSPESGGARGTATAPQEVRRAFRGGGASLSALGDAGGAGPLELEALEAFGVGGAGGGALLEAPGT